MLSSNLRLAGRSLLRSPGFTILAIITLGLGIGANTAMFSVINSILLKPLPYPESAQLDRIDRATAQNPEGRVSPSDFIDLQPAGSPLAAPRASIQSTLSVRSKVMRATNAGGE